MIELNAIEQARERLSDVLNATRAAASPPLSHLVGRPIFAKPEHLQRAGSFKIRGAYNFISLIEDSDRLAGVVAGSAGNHAQGVALAAWLKGLKATIFMPLTAAIPKVEATRGYGADVVLEGDSVDECIEAARDFSLRHGATFVPPFDDPAIIAGQATIGLEVIEEVPEVRTVVVPIGGGGLIAGIAAALKQKDARYKVIGVEPAGAASMRMALDVGRPVALEATDTMADGVAVRCVSQLTLEHVERYVDEVVTVEEEDISRAVLGLLERCKWLVEPAGALGIAALLAGKIAGDGPTLAVLSGGNIDPLLLTRLIEHGLSAAGRYLILRVVVSDTPGSLAGLTSAAARLGLNVISVDHHRSGASVNLDEVEVYLTVETRDPAHRDRIVPSLCEAGFRAEAVG